MKSGANYSAIFILTLQTLFYSIPFIGSIETFQNEYQTTIDSLSDLLHSNFSIRFEQNQKILPDRNRRFIRFDEIRKIYRFDSNSMNNFEKRSRKQLFHLPSSILFDEFLLDEKLTLNEQFSGPKFSILPKILGSNRYDNISKKLILNCKADGYPLPKIYWRIDNQTLSPLTSSSFSFDSRTRNDHRDILLHHSSYENIDDISDKDDDYDDDNDKDKLFQNHRFKPQYWPNLNAMISLQEDGSILSIGGEQTSQHDNDVDDDDDDHSRHRSSSSSNTMNSPFSSYLAFLNELRAIKNYQKQQRLLFNPILQQHQSHHFFLQQQQQQQQQQRSQQTYQYSLATHRIECVAINRFGSIISPPIYVQQKSRQKKKIFFFSFGLIAIEIFYFCFIVSQIYSD